MLQLRFTGGLIFFCLAKRHTGNRWGERQKRVIETVHRVTDG